MSEFGRDSGYSPGEREDMPPEIEIAEDTWDEGLRAAFAPPAPESGVPASFGRYQILGELGRGGIGVVYRAHDPDLRRDVAIKVLQDCYADDPTLVSRFVAEAQLAGQLEHPGIVPVHSLGVDSRGRPFFLMKVVAGRTLQEILERDRGVPGDVSRLMPIFLQVCQTVAYAHSRGVVHRDLKPANVMVGAFGEVQVMDWGFAKVLGSTDWQGRHVSTTPADLGDELSRPGVAMGTPGFMAPEQARGEVGSVDARSDVYALGAILRKILLADPAADAELHALAARCTAEDPGHRPADAGELAKAISGWLDGMAERITRARIAAGAAESRAIGERRARVLTLALSVAVILVGALSLAWYAVAKAEGERRRERRDADIVEQVRRARGEPPRSPRAGRGTKEALSRAGIDLETVRLADLATVLAERQCSAGAVVARGLEDMVARGDTQRDWLLGADALDLDGLRTRVRALWRARDTEKLRTLAKDLGGSPPEPATVVLLGQALCALGRDGDALPLLEATAIEHPGDLWLHLALVHLYRKRGPGARADLERHIEEAKRLNPDPGWEPLPPVPGQGPPPPRRGG